MANVARYEKRRSFSWLVKFFTLLLIATTVTVGLGLVAAMQIGERKTLDLLTIFGEDREIIEQFWQDTLSVFWQELPQGTLIIVAISCIVIVLLVVATRKKRAIIARKIQQLAKYR